MINHISQDEKKIIKEFEIQVYYLKRSSQWLKQFVCNKLVSNISVNEEYGTAIKRR